MPSSLKYIVQKHCAVTQCVTTTGTECFNWLDHANGSPSQMDAGVLWTYVG